MSTENKITEQELKGLQEKIGNIQNLQSQIGNIEGQKHLLLHQLVNAQDLLQKDQVALEDKYGKVSINIQDGTFEEIKEEAKG